MEQIFMWIYWVIGLISGYALRGLYVAYKESRKTTVTNEPERRIGF